MKIKSQKLGQIQFKKQEMRKSSAKDWKVRVDTICGQRENQTDLFKTDSYILME